MFNGLGKPDFKTRAEKLDGNNADIIRTVEKNFLPAVEQTKDFSKHFDKGTAQKTALALWQFLKSNIKYVKDPSHNQRIKLPTRFIADGTGDCKSYSLFAAAIMANLGYPVAFRYASYSVLSLTPTHVYTIAYDDQGNEIIIDAVWNSFNSEKKAAHKFDHLMTNVYTLSGTDEIGKIRLGKFLKKVAKGVSKGVKKAAGAGKKIGLAPGRRAFRTLVALNFRGLATTLENVVRTRPQDLQRKWKQLGGNYSQLLKSIQTGSKRKRILGIEEDAYLGETASTALILASATPIIFALATFLKKAGVKSEALDNIQDAAEKAAAQFPEYGGMIDPTDPEHSKDFDKDSGKDDSPEGFSLSPALLIGGGVVLYLLFNKRK